MKSMKKLGRYNSGPICQYPRAYLGFHIPKGFIGTGTTAKFKTQQNDYPKIVYSRWQYMALPTTQE